MQPKYDLLLRSGEVIDPSQNIRGRYDVALAEGKVALVAENIPEEQARQVKNVSGKLVTPGLIDIHGHFYHSFLPWCVDPDKVCLPNGVTTVVDAGSSGTDTYAGLGNLIAPQSKTRLYCFLHICSLGLVLVGYQAELYNITLANVENAAECVEENRERIVGINARMNLDATGYTNALPTLERALQAAEKAKVPVMVYVSNSPVPLGTVLDLLRPGDIVTPVFSLTEPVVLDGNRKVRGNIRDAVKRGIIFDAGQGMHLNYKLAGAAIEQGFLPHTLSTHIVDTSAWSGFKGLRGIPSLLEVMSAFLAMNLTLEDVVRCTTANAAAAIGLSSKIGSLRSGAYGDVAVLELQEGNFTWSDFAGNSVKGKQRLAPVMTICDGKVCYPAD